jgi:uncharacterized membrane protein YdjX (TVP38/TMEM64 family)
LIPQDPTTEPAPAKRRLTRGDAAKLGIFAVVAVLLVVAVDRYDLQALREPEVLEARLASLGGWVWPAYFGLWILMQVAVGQTAVPTIVGGILFGWLPGGLLAVVGAVVATSVHFLLVRTLLRASAEALIFSRFSNLKKGIEERGLALLILLRFLWFPSSLVTIGTAITRLPFRVHVAAVPAMLPQALLWCLATESFYRYDAGTIPTARYVAFGSIAGVSILVYFAAMRRWPQLKAFTKKGSVRK